MSGSNMFVVYADGSGNVTVSPRLGTGHVEPDFNSDARITVLEGSGVQSNGGLTANIRCDSCLSWNGGSMSATDSSSNWIYAHLGGSALDSTDTSESIRQHSDQQAFTLDLTQGTGGSSANPFIAAVDNGDSDGDSDSSSSSSSGSSPSATASSSNPSSTSGTVVGPVVSSGSDSSNSASSTVEDNTIGPRRAHGIIMSVTFVLVFPLAALTLYLPFAKRVLFVHAPLQVIGIILMLAGLGTGVVLGQRVDSLDEYHMIIGYLIVACLILFQPALGIAQHIYFRRKGGRSSMGLAHQTLGRVMIVLGIINGGLGFKIAGPVGNDDVPRGAVIAYGVIAGLVGIAYIAVVLIASRRSSSGGKSSPSRAEKTHNRYWETEMQPTNSSNSDNDSHWAPQGQTHGRPARANSNRYTITGREGEAR
jgi:hypothetical protein